ncbi:TonB-dependent receptor [Pseudoalteromonas sp. OOF1S-7]|uniref:TonB-dependent receptor domain-containing protein n=1 Tax=Pseudoalteromonas sp. OOF1S-7 TaxID=2917757 RepID=UPI001EF69048|nr:TonB-dependent receptor [Pseudoalteromonas sp. OOF1S-7]MCG7535673.1 TonB-dependent receptor [Pseudoalteromonas sp. OOF1S-7]
MFKKSTLTMAMLAVLPFSVLSAQDIEHITITANKFEQASIDTLTSVAVVERAEIERANVRDVPTLLNNLAGIDVVRSGGYGQKASVFVRGAATKYTLVLVDGVRISDANSGDVSFTNLPVNSIERIEVLKGARAAIYGSDAVAGVINIITREQKGHQLALTSGSRNYGGAQLAGQFEADKLTVNYHFGYETTDGYDVTAKDPAAPSTKEHDSDAYDNTNMGVKLGYDLAQYGQLALYAQRSEGEADYDSSYGNDAYKFDNYTTKLAWQKQSDVLIQEASISLAQEENTQFLSVKPENGAPPPEDVYSTKRDEFEYRARYKMTPSLQLMGGVSRLNEDLSSSSAQFSIAERDNTALFAAAFYDHKRWLLNTVVRSDDYEHHGRANTYTADVGFRASDIVTFRVNHGTAFRAPSLTNAFVKDSPWYLPNTEIKPEEGTYNEVGVTVESTNVRYDVAIFDNRIDNLISNEFDAQTNKYIPANVGRAHMKGIELSAQFSALGLEHAANLTLLDARDKEKREDLPRRPGTAFNYVLSKQWDKLDVRLAMQYRDKRPSISYFDTDLPSYTVFNLSANYQLLEPIALTLRLENLTDKEYFNSVASKTLDGTLLPYEPPGRQIYVGSRITF